VTPFLVYGFAAAALVAIGLGGALVRRQLVRQILALNIVSGGVFLLLIATAHRDRAAIPDPVPHAMVLTGIVVAVSISAFAIGLARRIHLLSGRESLKETDLE
jgi:multicomponent Na+:H+ antiporter subunit C